MGGKTKNWLYWAGCNVLTATVTERLEMMLISLDHQKIVGGLLIRRESGEGEAQDYQKGVSVFHYQSFFRISFGFFLIISLKSSCPLEICSGVIFSASSRRWRLGSEGLHGWAILL